MPPAAPAVALAELHSHLYGCAGADAVLARLITHADAIDLAPYESAVLAAYGAPSPARALIAAARAGDADARAAFARLFTFAPDDADGTFARFQARFELILAASAARFAARVPGRPLAALLAAEVREYAEAIAADCARDGVAYTEQRMLLPPEAALDAWPVVLAAYHAVASATPSPTLRLAPSLPRRDPWPQWEHIARLALAPAGRALTAVDFCHVEAGHPPGDKAEFFAAVRAFNARHPERALAILYHVGESFPDKSLESAVRWVEQAAEMGAHRLGHALALGLDFAALYGPHARTEPVRERLDQVRYDLAHADELARYGVVVDRGALATEARRLDDAPPDAPPVVHAYDAARLADVHRRQELALARVRRAGAVIEVCPSSNLRIAGLRDPALHPLARFRAAGLRVVIGADDGGLLGTTLRAEWAWAASRLGLTADELAAWQREAWDARSEVLSGRAAASRGEEAR